MRLQNKVAIVTGASSGLGLAIAQKFLIEGAKVVFSDLKQPAGFKKSANSLFVKCDVSKDKEIKKLLSLTLKQFGRLDVMVNNAGIGLTAEIATMPDKIWDKVIAVNLSGVFYGTRAASKYMKDKKIAGSIINMTSILGQVGFATAGAYCASKGGVNQLTRTSAIELAKDGIRVNAIAPGFIKTNMTKGVSENEQANQAVLSATPLGHMGEPDDIAYAAVYLASDESKFVTGSILYVDGGWTAQ